MRSWGWIAAAGTGIALVAPGLAAADHRIVHTGAWSYFGDPRSIVHRGPVFTGLIGTSRSIVVEQYDPVTGRRSHRHLFRQNEVDDHDNPSLTFWRGRLYAFFSPHSGRVYPRDRESRMRYRLSRGRHTLDAGFGRLREVATNTPGGLGFTYPNPIPGRGKLWLFWRGGDWNPTFSYTRDGRTWVRARTLLRGPRGQRPYSKYVGGRDGSIHMVFSDAHPHSYRTSLYYMRYRAGAFYAADGRRIGGMEDLPLPIRRLDAVYRYRRGHGRAWPHDVALDASGRPVVAYTRRTGGGGGTDTFYFGAWDGSRWRSHPIVAAGGGAKTFTSGGVTFDHADTSRVVLSRTIGRFNEIELWRTLDGGATWAPLIAVTSGSDAQNYRPVIPRGWTDAERLLVSYVHGTAGSFRSFRTVVRMSSMPAAPSPVAVTP